MSEMQERKEHRGRKRRKKEKCCGKKTEEKESMKIFSVLWSLIRLI